MMVILAVATMNVAVVGLAVVIGDS